MAVRIAVGEMFGEKPHVHFVGPYYVADDQIVSPVIAVFACLPRRPARLDEDLFMCVEQPRDLSRHRFSPFGRRAIVLTSATSCGAASGTPPREEMRSANPSISSTCSV